MTDRELLELAAKAAGLPVEFEEEVNGWYPCGRDEDGDVSNWWNPLIDDGDAMRLAVKIGIEEILTVSIVGGRGYVAACDANLELSGAEENLHKDPCAAIRLAIVRASAEIGRSME